jgi:ubiquitin carboxyl-terminal hydrolase 4/11/15
MDPESIAFQPRDDFWRIQSEMLRVQQNQVELADRVARLERKQDDDSRLKNVWGTSSPFPSVLGGTPQQGVLAFCCLQMRLLTGYSSLTAADGRALL